MAGRPRHRRGPPLMPTPQFAMGPEPHFYGAPPPLLPSHQMPQPSLLHTPGNEPIFHARHSQPHLLPQPAGILNPPRLPYNSQFKHFSRGNPHYNRGQKRPPPFYSRPEGRGQGRYYSNRSHNQYRNYSRRGACQDRGGNWRDSGEREASASDSNSYYNKSMFEDPWAELMPPVTAVKEDSLHVTESNKPDSSADTTVGCAEVTPEGDSPNSSPLLQ